MKLAVDFQPYFLFLSNRPLRVVLDGMFFQECPINAKVSQGSILGSSLIYITHL